jgi:steroid delta-isomerase-like uncharacterized protein
MNMNETERLVRAYYDAFNAEDEAGFFALLSDDVVHDINQGDREMGKAAFKSFWARMSRCYKETLTDIVVLTEPGGTRAAAEFVVHGEYIAADEGLPPARGQKYTLSAGAFFSIRDGKIARVSNYYNLPDWIAQVG